MLRSKPLLSVLLVIVFPQLLFSQSSQYELQESGLRGKVKILQEKSYSISADSNLKNISFSDSIVIFFDKRGRKCKKLAYHDQHKFSERVEFCYSLGKLKSIEIYEPSDTLRWGFKYRYRFKLKLTETCYRPCRKNEIKPPKNKFGYLIKFTGIKKNCFKEIQKTAYKYERGRLSEEKEMNQNGLVTDSILYYYDSASRLAGKVSYDHFLGRRSESYIYDSLGRVYETVRNSYAIRKIKYKYDFHGNVIESVEVDQWKHVWASYTFRYEYDNKLNWVKKIVSLNGVPQTVLIRQLKY